MTEKEKQKISKFLVDINKEYRAYAPFVCLGYGESFKRLTENRLNSDGFEGLVYSWEDLETRIVDGSQDIAYWRGTDETSIYFAPQNSKIAKLNPGSIKSNYNVNVEITKFVL
jgi:hypothetical protein